VADPDGTWLVLLRDVSNAIHVRGESRLMAGLVLDVGTGLLRGVAVAPTEDEALAQALAGAVSKPAGPLRSGQPDKVLCGPGLIRSVAQALGAVTNGAALPPVTEVDPPAEAEDIFDSLIGHMAGRTQPDDLPARRDWALLYSQALGFYRAEPWARWHDEVDLVLEVSIAEATSSHAAVVMGNAGLQHGLVLYPGTAVPPGLRNWQPVDPMPTPAGTLLCTLDPPGDVPAELSAKALRYGWPGDAELVPAFLSLGPGQEGGDPGRLDVQRLTVALDAVTALDARGPVLAGLVTAPVSGTVALSEGPPGSFTIHQRPPNDEPVSARFRVHQAGFDLVPEGTPVVLGHLPWTSLVSLRSAARIHRPFPPEAPTPTGAEVPLLVIVPQGHDGESIAAKTARLDPYGIAAIETDDGHAVLTLVGANGAELMMDLSADSPSLMTFQRRLRDTKGLHVVMIADQETTQGQGSVYGLFECHQPPPPPPRTSQSPRPSKPRPKRRRR
jgi:hypothetical protein